MSTGANQQFTQLLPMHTEQQVFEAYYTASLENNWLNVVVLLISVLF